MTEFFCQEHKTQFLKTKRGTYAHPVRDAQGVILKWCNMPAVQAPPAAQVGGSETGVNAPAESRMSKNDWAEKDRITRTSIHRQSASQRGVELVLGDRITFNQMPPWIKAFETYYDTGEWPVRPLTGHEQLGREPMVGPLPFSPPKPAFTTPPVVLVPPAIPLSAFPMCPLHKGMPLDKKTKDGTPAHEFTDEQGARHKCIPKLTSES